MFYRYTSVTWVAKSICDLLTDRLISHYKINSGGTKTTINSKRNRGGLNTLPQAQGSMRGRWVNTDDNHR